MKNTYRTQLLSGYFDCRIYRQGVAKENRQMKQDGEVISFNVAFSEEPKNDIAAEAAEFIRVAEVNGLKRWYATFKVGKYCGFFDKGGKRTERPTNTELDGKRWDAVIQYSVLHGDPTKMQPRGCWADAIQLKPSDEITFAPMESATVSGGVDTSAQAQDAPELDADGLPVAPKITDDLPF